MIHRVHQMSFWAFYDNPSKLCMFERFLFIFYTSIYRVLQPKCFHQFKHINGLHKLLYMKVNFATVMSQNDMVIWFLNGIRHTPFFVETHLTITRYRLPCPLICRPMKIFLQTFSMVQGTNLLVFLFR